MYVIDYAGTVAIPPQPASKRSVTQLCVAMPRGLPRGLADLLLISREAQAPGPHQAHALRWGCVSDQMGYRVERRLRIMGMMTHGLERRCGEF